MIDVRCLTCGSNLRATGDQAGRQLQCGVCQAVVDVPEADGFTVRDDVGANPFRATTPAHSVSGPPPLPDFGGTGSGVNAGIVIGSIAGGVVLLGGLIAGIVFAVTSANSDGENVNKRIVSSQRRSDPGAGGIASMPPKDEGDQPRGFAAAPGARKSPIATRLEPKLPLASLPDPKPRTAFGGTPKPPRLAFGGGIKPPNTFGGGTNPPAKIGGTTIATASAGHLRWILEFTNSLDNIGPSVKHIRSKDTAKLAGIQLTLIASQLELIVSRAAKLPKPSPAELAILKQRLEAELARNLVRIRTMSQFAVFREQSVIFAKIRIDTAIRRARAVLK